MSKYAPLTLHLQTQREARVPMTFADIEAVLTIKLPRSADRHRAWWSNNAENNVMTRAWLAAGFETEEVDLVGRTLVFRRIAAGARPSDGALAGFMESATPPLAAAPPPSGKHALFGWMRDTLDIAPGTDLTAPADPDWTGRIDDDGQPAA